jgi:two-component system, OmpR family, alkaline phosphatase synthesis response regulator PhoP
MGGRKVLVVEDEPAIVALLAELLADEGYEVATAADGREGLDRLAEVAPDVVLADVMMPVLDGRALCHAMSDDPRYRSTPIVLMSAAREVLGRCDCVCAGFLPKPFELDQVVAMLELALRDVADSRPRPRVSQAPPRPGRPSLRERLVHPAA